jgi:hypothetical protein
MWRLGATNPVTAALHDRFSKMEIFSHSGCGPPDDDLRLSIAGAGSGWPLRSRPKGALSEGRPSLFLPLSRPMLTLGERGSRPKVLITPQLEANSPVTPSLVATTSTETPRGLAAHHRRMLVPDEGTSPRHSARCFTEPREAPATWPPQDCLSAFDPAPARLHVRDDSRAGCSSRGSARCAPGRYGAARDLAVALLLVAPFWCVVLLIWWIALK